MSNKELLERLEALHMEFLREAREAAVTLDEEKNVFYSGAAHATACVLAVVEKTIHVEPSED